MVSRSFILEMVVSGGADPGEDPSGPCSSQPLATLTSLASAMLKWNRQIERSRPPRPPGPPIGCARHWTLPIGSGGMPITEPPRRGHRRGRGLAQVRGGLPGA